VEKRPTPAGKQKPTFTEHHPAQQAAEPPLGDPDKKLNLCWSEYVPQEIIDLQQRDGIGSVEVTRERGNVALLPVNYDLIQPSEYVIEGLIKETSSPD
jgi:hypothetical protein